MTKKRATSHDVAKAAGVSRTTVSFVLNDVPGIHISETTRQRVLDAAKKLNYHPDAAGRKLVSGKSNVIGLVLRQSPDQVFADALIPQVLIGVEHAASLHKFHVLLKPLDPIDSLGYEHLIRENHVDGIIISGPRVDDSEIIRLHQEGIPIMLMGQLPGSGIPFADIDAIKGAEIATRHLIENGHKRIGLITNAPLAYTSADQRRIGFVQALQANGLSYDQSLVAEGSYTPASGYTAMEKLLALREPPSAVFTASDVVALGAILAVKKAGLHVPEDIALVGFDDIPLAAYYDPPLTTIRLPAYGLGWAVCERLIRLIHHEDLDQEAVLLDPELVVRSSSC
jgi:DNA-binding LacI/PurR family transcriptional regulator